MPLIQEVDNDAGPPATLQLTDVEETLRRLLLDVAKHIDQNQNQNPSTANGESRVELPTSLANEPITLRFTGGWVRDKLLGVPSHDIDVAINKMTGYQFGLRLKEYLEIPGHPERYGLEGVATTDKQSQKAGTTNKSKTVGGLHKIEANPEKSKHLETVTTRILGLDIDLVNLRKESYTDDSRNPQMEFGTPEEDALRRDCTVNAMFYNITTEEVEDFTKRGYEDLQKHIIRTPLEPYQTFKDDPLRILRLIRFASRLDYTIEADTLLAMDNEDIKDALKRKISRERVGVELEKALRGPDPHEALRLIFDRDLYKVVFCDPTINPRDRYTPDTTDWQLLIDQLEEMLNTASPLSEILVHDKDDRYLAWLLAAFIPYRDAPQPPETNRRPPPPLATSVAREGIKAMSKTCDIVTFAIRNQSEISDLVDRVYRHKRRVGGQTGDEDLVARDVLGMAIRRWGVSWRSQVMYSLLVDIAQQNTSTEQTERKYTIFLEHLRDQDLLEVYLLKPLVDGKALAKALDTPPGPWMKDALDVVMAWQLRHPDTSSAQGAIEEVRLHGELASCLANHFLKLTIRPLFIKAKPDSITDQGRKNTTQPLSAKPTTLDESETKPWKSAQETSALTLLAWAVRRQNEKMVTQMWPLIVPPVLTLVDDWETRYKRLGSDLLRSVLSITPPELLERTGLASVFEEALLPCLTYLPPLTPEDESIDLLESIFPTLMTLSIAAFPKTPPPSSKRPSAQLQRERIKSLDKIIRKGIIYGYAHASQHPGIIRLLSDTLVQLLTSLGIDSVKHLKYILPMLNDILSQPLARAHTASLRSANRAMQAVVLNCWPRMVEHRGEVLKGLTLCWIKLRVPDGREEDGADELASELRETVAMLRAALDEQVDFAADCHTLVDADERLKGLFAVPE